MTFANANTFGIDDLFLNTAGVGGDSLLNFMF